MEPHPAFFFNKAEQAEKDQPKAACPITFARKKRKRDDACEATEVFFSQIEGSSHVSDNAFIGARKSGSNPLAESKKGSCAAVRLVKQKGPTQTFLDFGQAEFSSTRCKVCGMIYARGQEADEGLHGKFHQAFLKGPVLQSWPSGGVIRALANNRKIVMLTAHEQCNQRRKIEEISHFVEGQLGLEQGWLTQMPCKVFLMIGPGKHVIGFLAAERIQKAHPVCTSPDQMRNARAADDSCPQGESNSTSFYTQKTIPDPKLLAQGTRVQSSIMDGSPISCQTIAVPPAESEPAESAWSPLNDLPNSSSLRERPNPLLLAPPSPGMRESMGESLREILQPGPSLNPTTGSIAQKENNNSGGEGLSEGYNAARHRHRHLTGVREYKTVKQKGTLLTRWLVSDRKHKLSVGGTPTPAKQDAQAPSSPDATKLERLPEDPAPRIDNRAAVDAGAILGTEGAPKLVGNAEIQQRGLIPGSTEACRRRNVSGEAGSLTVDVHTAVEAELGVRGIWASASARRTGVASTLLDAARQQWSQGGQFGSLPTHRIAFTQPTDDGLKFAQHYTQQQCLIYLDE